MSENPISVNPITAAGVICCSKGHCESRGLLSLVIMPFLGVLSGHRAVETVGVRFYILPPENGVLLRNKPKGQVSNFSIAVSIRFRSYDGKDRKGIGN